MSTWKILEGDCRDVLATLDAGSVQTCVTSPPYFGLRDYDHDGQIGLEPTPDEFVRALVGVFREVRRVLRDDGTVWLNLGDSYNAYNGNRGPAAGINAVADQQRNAPGRGLTWPGAKPKDLLGIPWMVAFALRADGWYLRSDIIWSKPNPMPESVTDRPTKAHEYLFLLSKGPRYYYDTDAIREGFKEYEAPVAAIGGLTGRAAASPNAHQPALQRGRAARVAQMYRNTGRNKRSVWTVASQPYPGTHFATFPPKLITPCIRAGSTRQACGVCGTPWERVVERTGGEWVRRKANGEPLRQGLAGGGAFSGITPSVGSSQSHTLGRKSACVHDDSTGVSVVLDPFVGSGATGVVAVRYGRDFIGVELNSKYVEMARTRVEIEGEGGRRMGKIIDLQGHERLS